MTIRRQFDGRLAMTMVIALVGARALAQETPAADDKERQERLIHMKQQAAEYTLTVDGSGRKLTLHDDAVLRFSNPVGGVPDGIVVMWKDGQRPAVFAQVFQIKDGRWLHECQSLALSTFKMQSGEKIHWQPKEPAEPFRSLAEGPAPAAAPGRRLVQMKAIAAEFSAADDFKISSTDQETTRHELRLLPTPIYRYEDKEAGILDGAVFAFVHGTDPEVFLVLECRDAKDGKMSWHYTLAPMTCWSVSVMRQDKEVWSVPERLNKSTPTDMYHIWFQPESLPRSAK
jgi:hypothetical protein